MGFKWSTEAETNIKQLRQLIYNTLIRNQAASIRIFQNLQRHVNNMKMCQMKWKCMATMIQQIDKISIKIKSATSRRLFCFVN